MVRETLSSMVAHDFYIALPAPNYLRTYGIDTLGHSQSGEFPLYYDMLFWPLDTLRFVDITTQLMVSRAVTALFFPGHALGLHGAYALSGATGP